MRRALAALLYGAWLRLGGELRPPENPAPGCPWCGAADLNLDPLDRGGCSLCVLVARRELAAPRPPVIRGGAA